ncbi:sulfur carrier protein ThiS [Desulfosporosinus nitroreducens]|uniref:Sulfur carrier protein ThiS n=1 Tax=Desulfosporosinus nitroreducens TaxID=2018668 RepID=A0ABT8QQB1_9FIRM|nr:sulfur carrier protein ThiS [Desulfosporosinus nitroreducens]MDO0823538.1 sulfur carrier protein ThiS [Desulfosporosinus nitroreducens]
MRVNGTLISLDKSQTLFDFLQSQSIDINTIAVERNGEIIPRSTYQNVVLSDEDTLEIVRFVGGG